MNTAKGTQSFLEKPPTPFKKESKETNSNLTLNPSQSKSIDMELLKKIAKNKKVIEKFVHRHQISKESFRQASRTIILLKKISSETIYQKITRTIVSKSFDLIESKAHQRLIHQFSFKRNALVKPKGKRRSADKFTFGSLNSRAHRMIDETPYTRPKKPEMAVAKLDLSSKNIQSKGSHRFLRKNTSFKRKNSVGSPHVFSPKRASYLNPVKVHSTFSPSAFANSLIKAEFPSSKGENFSKFSANPNISLHGSEKSIKKISKTEIFKGKIQSCLVLNENEAEIEKIGANYAIQVESMGAIQFGQNHMHSLQKIISEKEKKERENGRKSIQAKDCENKEESLVKKKQKKPGLKLPKMGKSSSLAFLNEEESIEFKGETLKELNKALNKEKNNNFGRIRRGSMPEVKSTMSQTSKRTNEEKNPAWKLYLLSSKAPKKERSIKKNISSFSKKN